MNGEKDLKMSELLDFYGELLTEKQRDVIDLYYNEDLSLAEIAEHERITRQGVRDSIKRGEQTMAELEDLLRLSEKSKRICSLADRLEKLAAQTEPDAAAELLGAAGELRDIL